jgi:alpha-1,2-mannosyltransferase
MPITSGNAAYSFLRRQWFGLSLVVLFLALSIQYTFKAIDDRSAILRWRTQILQLGTTDIYERYTYPNPPIMPLLLTPIAELPPVVAALTWFFLKLGMAFVGFWWCFRLVEMPGRLLPKWGRAAVIALSLKPVMGDLSHGNVNLFILFLVIGGLYAFRNRYDFTAGVAVALAIACKVTPALLVPYFVWKRAWKALAGCVAGLVLFLFLVPGLFLGMERNVQLLTSWYGHMVQPFVGQGIVTTEHINQSLPGLIYRWGSHSPSSYDKEGRPLEYVNLWDLDPRLLGGLVKLFIAGFAATIVWTCRTPTNPRVSWRLAAEYSFVILGMLLFSERTWKHHCVTLMLPFTVLVYYYAACDPGTVLRRYLIATLVGVEVLMGLTMGGAGARWNQFAKGAEAAGAYVWGFLALAVALVVLLRRRDAVATRALGVRKAA